MRNADYPLLMKIPTKGCRIVFSHASVSGNNLLVSLILFYVYFKRKPLLFYFFIFDNFQKKVR